MEYELSSDFSAGPEPFLLSSINKKESESIIIVSKDYRINYMDHYVVIKSHTPRIIQLYDLPLEPAGTDLLYNTSAIHIKALTVSGVHKISAGKYNTIDEYQPCYELSSGDCVTLVPVGNTWYSF
jgi:hypothetical protein